MNKKKNKGSQVTTLAGTDDAYEDSQHRPGDQAGH